MSLRIGETFAGYRILRLLGSGGMGEVYLAQHPRLPRQDALKVLRADISSDSGFRERFIREADLVATLSHPHIVGVHDRGECEGQLWIAMDYIDGIDATHRMEQRHPAGMPVEEVADIVTAVASALDYAHKRGLLHRDVKPANIMLAHLDDPEERRIVLSDFGIARPLDSPNGLTATNMTVGTVAYAAPEQLLGEDIDGRADQYALAATAYELLTGQTLFPASNPAVIISRHLNSEPPALADTRPDLARLDPVLRAGLAKRPDERFRRCNDFARAFSEQTTSAETPTPAAPTTPAPIGRALPATPAATIQPALAPKQSRVWIVVATVGILALVGGVLLALRPWETRPIARGSAAESLKPSTALMPAPEPVPTTRTTEPPPTPMFSPKSIDRVLLTPDQLTNIVGVEVTDNPSSGGIGVLTLTSSAYGMSDHASQVTPRSCVGVVFTGEHDLYADAAPSEIKSQAFGNLFGGDAGKPHLLQQTAAVFSSGQQAQQFLTASQARWKACASGDVDAKLGYENSAGYALGTVHRQGDLITVAMATNGGLNGPDACQQALGARENVVVETRTCEVPDVQTTYDPTKGWPRDPGWAVPDAERLAEAMLENVTP